MKPSINFKFRILQKPFESKFEVDGTKIIDTGRNLYATAYDGQPVPFVYRPTLRRTNRPLCVSIFVTGLWQIKQSLVNCNSICCKYFKGK